MKQRLTTVLVSLVLAGCSLSIEVGSDAKTPTLPNIGDFSLAENNLYGCGMALWKPDRTTRDQDVFFQRHQRRRHANAD
ncbi:MAG: hypothetical protein SNJ57_10465 [Cyanobacteriota bacterium]